MAAYTIEDIELIRRKSGISYQEAVALLDYHNGNVARALIDLERNGRILSEVEQNRRAEAAKTEATKDRENRRERRNGLFQKLYRHRLKVKKGDVSIANVSALFCIACALFAPHMSIAALIAALVLGYKINLSRDDEDFSNENLEKMVRNAAENVKSGVSDIARGFADGVAEAKHEAETRAAEPAPKTENASRSFYQANPAATTAHAAYTGSMADIPTIQVPVKVESQDGDVTIEAESDGHNSATIG